MIETREQGAEMVSHTNEAINPLTVNDTANMRLKLPYIEQIEAYAQYLHDHGRTDRTVHTVRKQLRNLFKRLPVNSLEDVEEKHIRQFIATSGLKESTVQKYLGNFDKMCYVLTGKHVVKDMDILWNRIEADRLFITREEFTTVLEHTKDRRTRMILVLGAYMGLRTVEMERMKVSDIHDNYVIVKGKGHGSGLQDKLPIPNMVKDELNRYLPYRNAIVDGEHDYLLFTMRGGKIDRMREENNLVWSMIHKAGKDVGIEITPHSLRRLFATTLYYELGTDIVTVKELMRHASTATTMDNYIRCYPSKKIEAMDRLTTLYTHKDSTE